MIRQVLLNRRVNVRVVEKKTELSWTYTEGLECQTKELSCKRLWGATEGFRRG